MARKSRMKPYEAVPGKDVFGNIVNPGETVAMATKSFGGASINKGQYLGLRQTGFKWRPHNYVVSQNRVRRVRMNANGVIWKFVGWRDAHLEQRAELEAAIGTEPVRPHNPYRWNTPEFRNFDEQVFKPYQKLYAHWNEKREAWLDANYPWTQIPYVRYSTLQLNKIIKL